MSLLEEYRRITAGKLKPAELAELPALVAWCEDVLAIGARLELGELSRLEFVALAAAARRRESVRIACEGAAAQSVLGVASALAPVDGGAAGAEFLAAAGLAAMRADRA